MAEGRLDEMEMGEREVDYEAKYDNLDNSTLNDEYDSLEYRLVRDSNDYVTKDKIEYINTLWGSNDVDGALRLRRRNTREGGQMDGTTDVGGGVMETDFGGGASTAANMRHGRAVSMVERFIKETLEVDINWGVDEGNDLNNRISLSKEGNVLYSRMGDKGKLVKPQIVLEMRGKVLDYNKSKSEPIVKAVNAFKESIGIVADQSEEVDADIESMPMVVNNQKVDGAHATRGSQLPPGVYGRLSEVDQREIDGAVSIELSKSAKMNDREAHLRIDIDKWQAKKELALDVVRNEPNVDKATKLHQKVSDYEAVVEAIKDRIELEKTYGEQVEDVTRLQRLKKWLKENMVGLSAVSIAVASIVTAIIIGARTAITKGAQAVTSFAKMVKNAIAKLGPWAVGLANLAFAILKFGAQALAFLARNLWLIVVTVAYCLWEMYKNRKRSTK